MRINDERRSEVLDFDPECLCAVGYAGGVVSTLLSREKIFFDDDLLGDGGEIVLATRYEWEFMVSHGRNKRTIHGLCMKFDSRFFLDAAEWIKSEGLDAYMEEDGVLTAEGFVVLVQHLVSSEAKHAPLSLAA